MTGLRWPLSVPVLTDGIVTLRATVPADVDAIWEMTQDPDMQRFTSIPLPHTRDMSEQFALVIGPRGWDDGTCRHWAIEAADDAGQPRYAGNLEIRGGPIADLGFALHPWARGRGLMTRAVRLAVDHVLNEASVEAVHWRAHVGNEASLRVAHACGFTLVGTTPAILHERGRTLDAWTAVFRFGDAPMPQTRWVAAPTIEADTVRLRPFQESDADRVAEACGDAATQHWLNTMANPYTVETARAYLTDTVRRAATGQALSWAVADPATDVLLGNLTVMHLRGPNPGSGALGYWTHPDARGRGVMTAAVRAGVPYALSSPGGGAGPRAAEDTGGGAGPRAAEDTGGGAGPRAAEETGLGLHRLSLMAAAANVASHRVAEKSGFTRTGVEREAELLGDGTVDDLVLYDVVRPRSSGGAP